MAILRFSLANSRVRVFPVALASFAIAVLAQLYGTVKSFPNLKTVHETNMSFYSPKATLLGYAWLAQHVFSATWLLRFWSANGSRLTAVGGPRTTRTMKSGDVSGEERMVHSIHDKKEDDATLADASSALEEELGKGMVAYLPYHAVGTICITIWTLSFLQSSFVLSEFIIALHALIHLYFIHVPLRRLSSTCSKPGVSSPSFLTHLVSKTTANTALVITLQNFAIAYFNHQRPNYYAERFAGLVFTALACSAGDWILGSWLVADLIALAIGQAELGSERWAITLGIAAGAMLVLVVIRNIVRSFLS